MVFYAGIMIGLGALIWQWGKSRAAAEKESPSDPEPAPNPAKSMTVGFSRRGGGRRR
jgi:hypothetical protein